MILTENRKKSEDPDEHGDGDEDEDEGVQLVIVRLLHYRLCCHGVVIVVEVTRGDWLGLVRRLSSWSRLGEREKIDIRILISIIGKRREKIDFRISILIIG